MPSSEQVLVDTLNSNAVVGRASGQSLPLVSGWVGSDVAFDGKREDTLLTAKADPVLGVPSPQCWPLSPQVTVCFISVFLALGSSRASSEKELVHRYGGDPQDEGTERCGRAQGEPGLRG